MHLLDASSSGPMRSVGHNRVPSCTAFVAQTCSPLSCRTTQRHTSLFRKRHVAHQRASFRAVTQATSTLEQSPAETQVCPRPASSVPLGPPATEFLQSTLLALLGAQALTGRRRFAWPDQPSRPNKVCMQDLHQTPAAEPLNWTKQWYPVHAAIDLDPAKPHAINLLGKAGNLAYISSRFP